MTPTLSASIYRPLYHPTKEQREAKLAPDAKLLMTVCTESALRAHAWHQHYFVQQTLLVGIFFFLSFTLPYLTLPYLTLPYLTLPYLTIHSLYRRHGMLWAGSLSLLRSLWNSITPMYYHGYDLLCYLCL